MIACTNNKFEMPPPAPAPLSITPFALPPALFCPKKIIKRKCSSNGDR